MSDLHVEAKRQSLIRKITALATKKTYPLPDLDSMTVDQLKALIPTIKHSQARMSCPAAS